MADDSLLSSLGNDDDPDDVEPGAGADDVEPADDSHLSQKPETVKRRNRRRKKTGGGSTPRRASTRREPTAGEVTRRLRESLAALANALEDRDPELSQVLQRDGPKMADLLGKWGEHPKTPPPLKVAVVVIAEVLEPLRAFGATVRILLRRFRERRYREPEPELDQDGRPLAWSDPAEPELDERPDERPPPPARFRVGTEPPEVN